jgi:gluconate 2-dehydrogenase gamma chain
MTPLTSVSATRYKWRDIVDRRNFLAVAAITGRLGWTTKQQSLHDLRVSRAAAAGCKVLTADEAATVEAVIDQIVPADDYPGARQAGVLYFIDGALAGPLARFRQMYGQNLTMLDRLSQERFGNAFPQITWNEQTSMLRALESGEYGVAGQQFFSLIRQHTFQGYYGEPEEGGNKDGMSWKMLDFKR